MQPCSRRLVALHSTVVHQVAGVCVCRLLLRHQHSRPACRVIRIRKEIKAGHSGGGGASTHILMAFVLHAHGRPFIEGRGLQGAGLRLGGGGSAQGGREKQRRRRGSAFACGQVEAKEGGSILAFVGVPDVRMLHVTCHASHVTHARSPHDVVCVPYVVRERKVHPLREKVRCDV
jgi:hypothetical protein